MLRNEKKPTTSVTVVTNGLEATAGSTLSRCRASGMRIPPSAAAIRLQIIASPIFAESMKNMKQEIIDKWAACPARDTEGREWLWQGLARGPDAAAQRLKVRLVVRNDETHSEVGDDRAHLVDEPSVDPHQVRYWRCWLHQT